MFTVKEKYIKSMYTIVLFNSWWSINLYSIEAAHTPEDIVHITPPGGEGGGGLKKS